MHIIEKITLITLIAIIDCNGTNDNKPVPEKQTGPELSNVILSDLNGIAINLEQYKGKTMFINFWATWCKPCLKEMPSIEKAQELLKNKNIEFLFASNETADQI